MIMVALMRADVLLYSQCAKTYICNLFGFGKPRVHIGVGLRLLCEITLSICRKHDGHDARDQT
jgi:hypothetical protein